MDIEEEVRGGLVLVGYNRKNGERVPFHLCKLRNREIARDIAALNKVQRREKDASQPK